MPSIHFRYYGAPMGKERARVVNGRAYTPAKTKGYEEAVTAAVLEVWTGEPIGGAPMKMRVNFYMPFPKSYSKRKRSALRLTEHIQKPDLSNLVKAVEDACTGVVYKDDAQVYYVEASKKWQGEAGYNDPLTVQGFTCEFSWYE